MGLTPQKARQLLGNLNVKPNRYPYTALLLIVSHLCTGTVLHHHWLLTAAHCYHKEWEGASYALVGDVRYRPSDAVLAAGVQRRPLLHLLRHPQYGGGVAHDAMLAAVRRPLVFSERCHHLPLTDLPTVAGNETLECEVAGFAVRGARRAVSLQASPQRVSNLSRCRAGTAQERRAALCADSPRDTSETAACRAGSGAPLVCGPGHLTAIMHYSRHVHCEQRARLNVFVFVGPLKPWLLQLVPDLPAAAWSRAAPAAPAAPSRLLPLLLLQLLVQQLLLPAVAAATVCL